MPTVAMAGYGRRPLVADVALLGECAPDSQADTFDRRLHACLISTR
jgi:hypothetical protein